MPINDRKRILRAMAANPWDLSNKVLYDLCHTHSDHRKSDVVIAKILLIGRVYAAAIERRKTKVDEEKNENFYIEVVAPTLQKSEIDRWIEEAKAAKPGTSSALATLVKVHGLTTALFNEISGLEKRSLASKYLHFHVPELFYIYDSRAANGLREFAPVLPRASRSVGEGDNEYRKFAEKCDQLQKLFKSGFDLRLSPRQLDNLLLGTGEV
jgi:hypothetical protein